MKEPSPHRSAHTAPAGNLDITHSLQGIPDGVVVRRSSRRRRRIAAYRESGQIVVLVPVRAGKKEIEQAVHELVHQITVRERKQKPADDQLMRRAQELSHKYLAGQAHPASVRWVHNQRRRWGSCTTLDRSIRLSHLLQQMPTYVIDAVLFHELVHLLIPDHGPEFERYMSACPHREEADAYLAGYSHAVQYHSEESEESVQGISGKSEGSDEKLR